jgi:hypothetical protein
MGGREFSVERVKASMEAETFFGFFLRDADTPVPVFVPVNVDTGR